MERLKQIEELCAKYNLQCRYDVLDEGDNALFVNMAELQDVKTLKGFVAELPNDSNINYQYTGDYADEEWQRTLCMVFE